MFLVVSNTHCSSHHKMKQRPTQKVVLREEAKMFAFCDEDALLCETNSKNVGNVF